MDESSNLLVTAVAAYAKSELYEVGCKIFAEFGDRIVEPLCNLPGIDGVKNEHREDRNWTGVKIFYNVKLCPLPLDSLRARDFVRLPLGAPRHVDFPRHLRNLRRDLTFSKPCCSMGNSRRIVKLQN